MASRVDGTLGDSLTSRTPVWIVSLALLAVAVAGASAAQQTNASASFRADAASAEVASERAHDDHAAFAFAAMPHEKRALPGAVVSFDLYAKAREPTLLHLELKAPEGVRAALSEETLRVAPGERAGMTLKVLAPDEATREPIVLGVLATDKEGGETRAVRIALHVVAKEPAPKPAACPKAEDASSERPCPPAPRVRMTLIEERATFVVGEDGTATGRVALLIEGGHHAGPLALDLRVPEGSGWRVHLERDVVKLGDDGRTFVWIGFRAPADAEPLPYSVHASTRAGPAGGVGGAAQVAEP
jgi:hypothetical protein